LVPTYAPLLFIKGAYQVFYLIFAIIGPSVKEKKTPWRLPKIEGSILKYSVPSFWPSYIVEQRTTFGKAYGIKVRCYWELFGEHIRNLGTLYFEKPPPSNKREAPSLHDA
jgi:hypothetical protein